MNFRRLFLTLALSSILVSSSVAVEIPLDSLGEATKVAYVNMHKIFEVFPETEQARRQVTRTIEEKQSEITLRKEEVARLKGEVDFLAEKLLKLRQAQDQAAIAKAGEAVIAKQNQQQTLESASLQQNSVELISQSSQAVENATSLAVDSAQSLAQSVAISSGFLPVAAVKAKAAFSEADVLAPQLQQKQELLSKKQVDLDAFVGGTEEEIAKLRDARNMELLSRIYKVLEEVSVRSGYTVILDRDNVLYGQETVDITDLVIERLRRI